MQTQYETSQSEICFRFPSNTIEIWLDAIARSDLDARAKATFDKTERTRYPERTEEPFKSLV